MNHLQQIIYENNLEALKEYLRYNDINILDENDNSLLHYALTYKRLEIIYFLLDNHILINQANKQGITPLYLACHLNLLMIVDVLLSKNVNTNLITNGETAFWHACRLGRKSIIALFFEYQKVDLDFKDSFGENYLFALARNNDFDLFKKYYLERFLFIKNDYGENLLHIAAKYSDSLLVKFLLDKGINPNLRNKFNETPLFGALTNNQINNVKILLKFGALSIFKNKFGEKASDLLVKLALDEYDRTKEYQAEFPLHFAIIVNDHLSFNKNLNIYEVCRRDFTNKTPLDLATIFERTEFTKEIKLKLSQNLSYKVKRC